MLLTEVYNLHHHPMSGRMVELRHGWGGWVNMAGCRDVVGLLPNSLVLALKKRLECPRYITTDEHIVQLLVP